MLTSPLRSSAKGCKPGQAGKDTMEKQLGAERGVLLSDSEQVTSWVRVAGRCVSSRFELLREFAIKSVFADP